MAKATKSVSKAAAPKSMAEEPAVTPSLAEDGTAAATPPPVSIGVQDLAFIVQIIDTLSRRGGFQGDELAVIGTYRNRVDSWVKQNTPAAAADGTKADDTINAVPAAPAV